MLLEEPDLLFDRFVNDLYIKVFTKKGIIMSTDKTPRNSVQAITSLPQRVIHYISSAAMRIFSPSDDNYPATGVQPYEGDPADEKSL